MKVTCDCGLEQELSDPAAAASACCPACGRGLAALAALPPPPEIFGQQGAESLGEVRPLLYSELRTPSSKLPAGPSAARRGYRGLMVSGAGSGVLGGAATAACSKLQAPSSKLRAPHRARCWTTAT